METAFARLNPPGQPDYVATVEATVDGGSWTDRWADHAIDGRSPSAHVEFHRRCESSGAADVVEVWERHQDQLGDKAVILGNRNEGTARHLTPECARAAFNAAVATFADSLIEPLPEGYVSGRPT